MQRFTDTCCASFVVITTALTLLLSACGGGGESTAPPPDETQRVIFEDAAALTPQRELITMLIEDTMNLAAGQIPVATVTAVVRDDAARTIPDYGLGGYALSPQRIEIVIDAEFPDLENVLLERLPYVVAHELHHTVRLREPGIYESLLEALIFEGMADHFAVELLGSDLAPWSQAFPESETATYLSLAAPQFDQTFDFEAWFFGIGTSLPQWTGYTLGYQILRDYFDANPQENAVTSISAPADQFRPSGT
ncbi:MAG: DUF2268 domain-containing putative Zn-dependent protease [Pseudomonadota bacterium]